MRNYYWDDTIDETTDEDYEIYSETLFEEVDDDTFHIGQYDEEPAKKLRCKKCGSEEFIVGSGEYFTAIKCPVCGWEKCIHEG